MDPNHGQSRSTFRTLSDKLFNSYLLYSTRESYSEKKIQSERFCAAIRATVTKDFDAKSQNIGHSKQKCCGLFVYTLLIKLLQLRYSYALLLRQHQWQVLKAISLWTRKVLLE